MTENLADTLSHYDLDEVALLVIDVQKGFCAPKGKGGLGSEKTKTISEHIQSIAPEFRKVVQLYAVYFSGTGEQNIDEIGFYKFNPSANDTLIAKNQDSAFKGSDIANILNKDGKKLLLTCGFNLSACVQSTVMDARQAGFEVCLLKDLSANGHDNRADEKASLHEMRQAGAVIASSEAVLNHLRTARP